MRSRNVTSPWANVIKQLNPNNNSLKLRWKYMNLDTPTTVVRGHNYKIDKMNRARVKFEIYN